jgi:hypothetical protein
MPTNFAPYAAREAVSFALLNPTAERVNDLRRHLMAASRNAAATCSHAACSRSPSARCSSVTFATGPAARWRSRTAVRAAP